MCIRDSNYSFNYQNWYPSAKYETINARKNVGLFDFSTFSKFDLKGEKLLVIYKKFVQPILKMKSANQLIPTC